MNTLVIDIGATKIASGIVDGNGAVSNRLEAPTTPQDGALLVAERAIALARQVLEQFNQPVRGLGIATGGDVDVSRGVITYGTPVIPDWTGLAIRDLFERQLQLPTQVDNDGNCAALAEVTFGAARGYAQSLTIIIGTGIGAGYVFNGSVLHGAYGGALNPGQIWLDNLHTYEDVVSCGALARLYNMPIHQLAALIKTQPAWPQVLIDAAEKIGRLIAICTAILDPQIVVIAGSILLFGDVFMQHTRESFAKKARPPQRVVPVVASSLDANSALIGASLLFDNQLAVNMA